jgi:hypothetical protein
MMVVREACPACGSQQFKKNGHIHNGKQNHQCKACGRQFVLFATQRLVPAGDRTLVERLLCEKISLHGICRVVGVSIRWLMDFVSARFTALPDHLYANRVRTLFTLVRSEADSREQCNSAYVNTFLLNRH